MRRYSITFSGKISLSLLDRRNSFHYRYWLEIYLL